MRFSLGAILAWLRALTSCAGQRPLTGMAYCNTLPAREADLCKWRLYEEAPND